MHDKPKPRIRCWQLLLILVVAFVSAITCKAQASEQHYLAFFDNNALPLSEPEHLAPLYDAVGERRFVLLGESTHGTHEYYHWRAKISRELITQHGFSFIAVEGDWLSIYQLNDFVKLRDAAGENAAEDARTLLRNHAMRWPRWMWINEDFADFLDWLRAHNAELPMAQRVGVFGIDMQDPQSSMEYVLDWFQQNDTSNYPQVADAYRRILDFPEEFRGYAQHLAQGGERLNNQMAHPAELLHSQLGDNPAGADKATWVARENALAAKRAEAQFHGATQQGPESWNARASFMHEALLRLAKRHGTESRGIVWAHNTHVGDSAATSMRNRGEVNIGHLLRTSEGEDDVFILGFGTYQGSVIASASWGEEHQEMTVVPAHPESFEGLLHQSGIQQGLFLFDDTARQGELLTPRPHRAIGVIYSPPNEAYVPTILTRRYDGFIYFDETQALKPL
ncbi:erythromycin esterase family protein [Vreelandella zhaodongensis]|uniref:erythromycin esterase family protein n=1 Tax=Vreelandella zhaodongensis TaxID=1176240 RepID=UPI003EC13CDE